MMRCLILAAAIVLAGCNKHDNADSLGGGQGSSNANDVAATGNGFCGPTGGLQSLGSSSYDSGSVTARIDDDGDPQVTTAMDPNHQDQTSGTVNGQSVNAGQYSYVVLNAQEARNDGIALGDWAVVTNTSTGAQTFARYEENGPSGGEISEAAANAVGISYDANRFTTGNPSISVAVYGGSSGVQGDCENQQIANQ